MVRNNVNIPKCEDLQYGKQERNPKYGTSQKENKGVEGYLKINNLEYGNIIFYDQYKSILQERVFGNRGSKINYQVYK